MAGHSGYRHVVSFLIEFIRFYAFNTLSLLLWASDRALGSDKPNKSRHTHLKRGKLKIELYKNKYLLKKWDILPKSALDIHKRLDTLQPNELWRHGRILRGWRVSTRLWILSALFGRISHFFRRYLFCTTLSLVYPFSGEYVVIYSEDGCKIELCEHPTLSCLQPYYSNPDWRGSTWRHNIRRFRRD